MIVIVICKWVFLICGIMSLYGKRNVSEWLFLIAFTSAVVATVMATYLMVTLPSPLDHVDKLITWPY